MNIENFGNDLDSMVMLVGIVQILFVVEKNEINQNHMCQISKEG
jgi:hypothetical protein